MTLTRRIAAIAVLAALGGAQAAHAQATASQTAGGTGTVFRPIVVTKNTDLSFGGIIRPLAGSGTVTIDPATGDRTVDGNAAGLGSGQGGAPTQATFTVGGEGGQTFSISVPANVTMTRDGGSETLVATLTPTATSGTLSNSLGANGAASFGVGGVLPVTNATVSGSYAGAFVVTVEYN